LLKTPPNGVPVNSPKATADKVILDALAIYSCLQFAFNNGNPFTYIIDENNPDNPLIVKNKIYLIVFEISI